jgi:hypothetical protein
MQDVNAAQYELVHLLKAQATPGSLFLVGDLNQAIYGFRGANPGSMDQGVLADFPGCVTVYMADNYRYVRTQHFTSVCITIGPLSACNLSCYLHIVLIQATLEICLVVLRVLGAPNRTMTAFVGHALVVCHAMCHRSGGHIIRAAEAALAHNGLPCGYRAQRTVRGDGYSGHVEHVGMQCPGVLQVPWFSMSSRSKAATLALGNSQALRLYLSYTSYLPHHCCRLSCPMRCVRPTMLLASVSKSRRPGGCQGQQKTRLLCWSRTLPSLPGTTPR